MRGHRPFPALVPRRTALALGLALAATAPSLARPDGTRAGLESYRGYRLDLSAIRGRPEVATVLEAARHQVDIVEATILDATTKLFLRELVIVVEPGSGRPSHYAGGRDVTIRVANPTDDRPILLHELMHAYHLQRLPGGIRNPDILTFFRRARAGGLYREDAYLLRNPKEFFAMTASVYLHGRAAREPFTRAELRERQPVYYRYLGEVFGPVGG